VAGNLAWETLPRNLAWEPLPGNPVPNLGPCGFGCFEGLSWKRKPFLGTRFPTLRCANLAAPTCSDLLRNLYYGCRPQAYTVGEKNTAHSTGFSPSTTTSVSLGTLTQCPARLSAAMHELKLLTFGEFQCGHENQ